MPKRSDRIRIIAGPNGSGKSTLVEKLRQNFECGIYVNTDDLEKGLREKHFLNLSDYHIECTLAQYQEFLSKEFVQTLLTKAAAEGVPINLTFANNIFLCGEHTNSYEAELAGEFIKSQLVYNRERFIFETVMSHPSKLDFIKACRDSGYKIYLYFVSTDSVEINIGRVQQRVDKKGHNVAEAKIRSRFDSTLKLLSEIIPLTYRTFLFDNSSVEDPLRLIAEISNRGRELKLETNHVPNWVIEHVLQPLKFI